MNNKKTEITPLLNEEYNNNSRELDSLASHVKNSCSSSSSSSSSSSDPTVIIIDNFTRSWSHSDDDSNDSSYFFSSSGDDIENGTSKNSQQFKSCLRDELRKPFQSNTANNVYKYGSSIMLAIAFLTLFAELLEVYREECADKTSVDKAIEGQLAGYITDCTVPISPANLPTEIKPDSSDTLLASSLTALGSTLFSGLFTVGTPLLIKEKLSQHVKHLVKLVSTLVGASLGFGFSYIGGAISVSQLVKKSVELYAQAKAYDLQQKGLLCTTAPGTLNYGLEQLLPETNDNELELIMLIMFVMIVFHTSLSVLSRYFLPGDNQDENKASSSSFQP